MKRRYPLLILVLGLASACVLAACGGDDDDGGEEAAQQEQTPAETTGADGQADVALSEFEFDPADVTAEAGSTITLENVGSTEHDLRLREGGKDIGGTEVFDAGQSEELKVDFQPGKYDMYCSVPGHEDSGMKGTFTVK